MRTKLRVNLRTNGIFKKPNVRNPFQMLVGRRGLEPRTT